MKKLLILFALITMCSCGPIHRKAYWGKIYKKDIHRSTYPFLWVVNITDGTTYRLNVNEDMYNRYNVNDSILIYNP
jgi:hypothetical protein